MTTAVKSLRYTCSKPAATKLVRRVGKTDLSFYAAVAKLFPQALPFNVKIPANPVLDPNSAAWVTTWNSVSRAGMDMYEYGCPIYEILAGASPSSYASYTITATYSGNHTQTVRIPNIAAPAPGGDHAMVIIDWDLGYVYEFWNIIKSGANWVNGAQYGGGSIATFPITGSGIGDSIDGWKGAVGAGFSRALGILTKADLQNGWPNGDAGHALVFPTPFSKPTEFRAPALKTDGSNTGGSSQLLIPEGARFQYNPAFNVNATAWSTLDKFIARTLQNYGGYVMDNGGLVFICQGNDPTLATPPTDPGNPTNTGGWALPYGIQWDYYAPTSIDWSQIRWLKNWDGS